MTGTYRPGAPLPEAGEERKEFVADAIHHDGSMLAYCLGLVNGNEQVAWDLFQDASVEAIRTSDLLENERQLKPWLLRIALNKARNRPYMGGVSLEPLQTCEDPLFTEELGPSESLEQTELHIQIREQVDSLQPTYRQALQLRFFQGYSAKQAAEQIGCSERTVRRRVAEARKILRVRISEF